MATAQYELGSASVADLDPVRLYRILQLRTDVFVVEQACAYPELDGRDLEPDAVLVWAESDAAVLATLRVLRDADGSARIGRVATHPTARSSGLAGRLMRHALAQLGTDTVVVLAAQTQLRDWYARFGFSQDGAEFVEDGIPHIPMRRPATPETS